MKISHSVVLSLIGLCVLGASAEVSLPHIFGNRMVLQQEMPVPVWGWAKPGEKVTVRFAGQEKSAVADKDGKWMLRLDALKASSTPARFSVQGKNQITFSDVVVGEVWLCSGQSNMEFRMAQVRNAKQEIAAANNPLLRHFHAPKAFSAVPKDDVQANWELTTPQTIPGQSAIAYFFGKNIHQALKVPVGLINCSWGGSRIEAWIPVPAYDGFPSLKQIRETVRIGTPGTEEHRQVYTRYRDLLQKWVADADDRLNIGKPMVAPPVMPDRLLLPNPKEPSVQYQFSGLYNAMVAGIVPYAIRGSIWYQGCSNNGEGMLYLEKTKALVKGWRDAWGQGDFPYYLIQLAPFAYRADPYALPEIWEAQAAVPDVIPNSGYTVINDTVENLHDIHPTNKQIPARRLADQVLFRTYGKKGVVWQGPTYSGFTVEGNVFRVTFDHAEGLKTRDGKAPDWFEICGPDGVFQKADAKIDGASVSLTSPQVKKPIAMRFAWHQCAVPNLMNAAGLPAGAFRCGKNITLDGILEISELDGYQIIYQIDLPANGAFENQDPFYTVDHSKTPRPFKRVVYVLQLQKQNGLIQYVVTGMDAFTKDLKKLGIPTRSNQAFFQQKVENLTVRSNVPGVPNLTCSDGGNIEFWTGQYAPKNHLQLPRASQTSYDVDDTSVPGIGYGCMQVHSWKDRVTLWAYNNFNKSYESDIGIGNNPVRKGHPDYTFATNAKQYKIRRLTILVK